MQTKLSIISNIIFKYFIIFAISVLWLNFYLANLVVVIILSTIISITLGKVVSIIKKKKTIIAENSLKEQDHIKNISFQLLLTDHEKIINFYNILFKANHNVCLVKNQALLIDDKYIFIPAYSSQTISIDMVAEYYKQYKENQQIIIAGISFSGDAINLSNKIRNTKINLLNEQSTYKLFKKYDFYPDFKISQTVKEKFKLKNLKDIAFTKSNSKQYLYSAIIILITSLFINYSVYYLIFASLLFIFSAICHFKPQNEPSSIIDEL